MPLAAAGLLTLEQIFFYTLGTKVGTTITAIHAALAVGEVSVLSVAFAHMLFDVCGIWPVPAIRRLPIERSVRLTRIDPFEDDERRVETTVRTMFDLLLEALPARDVDRASEVMSEHWWIAKRSNGIVNDLLEHDTPAGVPRGGRGRALHALPQEGLGPPREHRVENRQPLRPHRLPARHPGARSAFGRL